MKKLLIFIVCIIPFFASAEKSDEYNDISFCLEASNPAAISLKCKNSGNEPQKISGLFAANFNSSSAFHMSPITLWVSIKCGNRIIGKYHDGFYNSSRVSSRIFTLEQMPQMLVWGNSSIGLKTSIKTLMSGMFDPQSEDFELLKANKDNLYYRILFSDTLYFPDNEKKTFRISSRWHKLDCSLVLACVNAEN